MIINNFLELLVNFKEICLEFEFFYSLARESAQSVVQGNNFLENTNSGDVFMNLEDYTVLKELFPEFVVDATTDSKYPYINPRFVANTEKWQDEKYFVNIHILVPTKIEKIKKFTNFKNKVFDYYHKNVFLRSKAHWTFKAIKPFFWIFKKLINPPNVYSHYANLLDDKYEGFYAIYSPSEAPLKNWFTHVTFKNELFKYKDYEFHLMKEHQAHIKNYFQD